MNRKDRRKEQAEQKRLNGTAQKVSAKDLVRSDTAIQARINAALADAEAGRMSDAEGQLRRILADAPDSLDAVNALGSLLFELGRFEDAADALLTLAVNNGTDAALHGTLAACLNLLGRHTEAEAAARFATELDPKSVAAFNNLAVAMESQGKIDAADAAMEQALTLDPTNADALVNRGNRFLRAGEADKAEPFYAKARTANPDNVIAAVNHAVALRTLGHLDDAIEAAQAGIALQSDYPEGHNTYGTVLAAMGDFDLAAEAFKRALALQPGFAGAAVNLGAALYRADDVEGALSAYQNAVQLFPAAAAAHVGIGLCATALGKTDVATIAFEAALTHEPDNTEALFNLAALGGLDHSTDTWSQLASIENDAARSVDDRVNAAFALVEIFDRKKNYALAMEHADQGNALRFEHLTNNGVTFDAEAYDALVNEVIATATPKRIQALSTMSSDSAMPIFVLGLPRSGTTLVERILAAHPAVTAAGERGVTPAVAELISDADYPETLIDPDPDAVADAVKAYLSSGPQAERVIDKTPFNGLYLGLIAGLFPKATLIRCRRNNADTALSCYLQNFRGDHAWSTRMADIKRFIAAEDRLFDHWRAALGSRLLEINYEEIVTNLTASARTMIDHCGLSWSDMCLDYANAPGAVKTASNHQVRQPLYASSIGRAAAYEQAHREGNA